jgi:hypothetical protein
LLALNVLPPKKWQKKKASDASEAQKDPLAQGQTKKYYFTREGERKERDETLSDCMTFHQPLEHTRTKKEISPRGGETACGLITMAFVLIFFLFFFLVVLLKETRRHVARTDSQRRMCGQESGLTGRSA